ncbi:MAG: flagellar biosynthetic protein FliO [Azoarcus sp.]|jgi:flagellar protein FliO/FliZ|nr:flagellar biosynthetic protein FliO [Azoarcus sp.]
MNAFAPVPAWPSCDRPANPPGPAAAALFALLFFALPGPCLADTQRPPVPDAFASIGQMLFGLAVVLALLIASLWLLKRFSAPVRGGGLLRVIAAAAVGPRERAVLLEAGDKIILLGVTPNNVRTLHTFERGELPAAVAASAAETPVTAFASRLRQALKGRHDAAS